ncbi:MAG: hypothetical protein ABJA75_12715 [Bradyrhizobium sp.]
MLSVIRPVAAMIPRLATLVLAGSLQLPEPMVHDTGLFVFVQVQAIENRIGRTLCPIRLLHRFRALFQS